MSAVVDVWGWRARFALVRGQTINDVIAKMPAIESGLGTFRGAARVVPTPDDLANRFELRVLDKDPHADAITWPGPSVTSITEPVDLGPFEDAAPAKVLFLRRHGLFGQHLVGTYDRWQLADKEKFDTPPAGIGVQDAKDWLGQQQRVEGILGGSRSQLLNGRQFGGERRDLSAPPPCQAEQCQRKDGDPDRTVQLHQQHRSLPLATK